VKRKDRGKSPPLEHPPSPHKIIQFEFIDEYPALMSDTYHYERTPTPSPPPTSVESPNTALGLLLEAANVSDGGSSDSRIGMPTPPLSPSDSVVLPVPYMSQSGMSSILLSLIGSQIYDAKVSLPRLVRVHLELKHAGVHTS